MKTKEILREIERLRDQINDLEGRVRTTVKSYINMKFEIGKVYIDEYSGTMVCVTDVKTDEIKGFGFGRFGTWYDDQWCWLNAAKKIREATEEEWLNALKKEAVRRGYKEGVFVKSAHGSKYLSYSGYFAWSDQVLWHTGVIIMKNGKWAEIVDEPSPEPVKKSDLLDVAETLEDNINKLKALL